MNFNGQQRAAIGTREHSIVAAGAGAGKTSVLVERYLSLLREDACSVDSILCLTFTRKAAAEMYERIYQKLIRSDDAVLQKAAGEFERARITTIDSFCSSIISQHLGDYGLAPAYRIADEQFSRDLKDFTLGFLAKAARTPLLQRLFSHFSAAQLSDDLLIPLAEGYFKRTGDQKPDRSSMGARLCELAADSAGSLTSRIAEIREALDDLRNRKPALDSTKLEGLVRIESALDVVLENMPDFSRPEEMGGEEFAQQLLLFTLESASLYRYKEWKGVLNEVIKPLRENLISPVLIASEWELYGEFYIWVEEYQQAVLNFASDRGVLYYRDLLDITVDLLQSRPDYADYFRRSIRHIMIDEFQDNNLRQKELLYLLAADEGYSASRMPLESELRRGVLYFVGDEKQSIYRFRGADVGVFKSMAGTLPDHGRIFNLDVNFRSSPQLISFFNEFFPRVMRGGESFEAAYRPLTAGLPASADGSSAPSVELLLIPGQDSDYDSQRHIPPSRNEAWVIAEKIRSLVDDPSQMVYDRQIGGPRRIRFGDIGVIFRRSGIQKELETMFRRFGIPYISDSTRTLFLDAPAYDIHSVFTLCLYPHDRLSLAAVLRSPIVRLPDDLIIRLLAAPDSQGLPTLELFRSCLSERSAAEPNRNENGDVTASDNDLIDRYRSLLALIEKMNAIIDHRPHTEVLMEFWRHSGYREFMAGDRLRRSFIRYYDYLVELFDLHAERSMRELLEILDDHLGDPKRLDDLELAHLRGDAVQIMTLHKSKGLEFPLVFLVNTNSKPRADREASAPYAVLGDGHLALYAGIDESRYIKVFGPGEKIDGAMRNPLVHAARRGERAQENAELRRHLYVAFTRAEQRLIISASALVARSTASELSGRIPRDDRVENLFDLIEGGIGINREELLEIPADQVREVASGGDGASLLVRRFAHLDEDVLRKKGFSGGGGDLNLPGLLPDMGLPEYRRRVLSVSALEHAGAAGLFGGQTGTGLTDSTAGKSGGDSPALSEPPSGSGRRQPDGEPPSGSGRRQPDDEPPSGSGRRQPDGEPPSGSGRRQPDDEPRSGSGRRQPDGEPPSGSEYGTLVHFLLEKAVVSLNRSGKFTIPGRDLVPESLLYYRGAELDFQAATEMAKGLTNTALFDEVIGAGERHAEMAFEISVENTIVAGQIDLLLVRGSEAIVVDYKTGKGGNPEQYQLQLDVYREAAKRLGYTRVKCIIADLREGTDYELPQRYSAGDLASFIVSEFPAGTST